MDFATASSIYSEYLSRGVSKVVDPGDHMWNTGRQWYDSVGRSGLRVLLNGLVLTWNQQAQVQRILDLPCGHGRVARHLRAAFPKAEMFFCDLDGAATEFCAKTFNGIGILSKPELTELSLPSNLDLIWIGSLFTHVDEHRTKRWLRYLASHLSNYGVLAATFHGAYSKELHKTISMINEASWQIILDGCERTGFGYAPYTEHNLGDFGVSLSRASKILEIAAEIEGTRVLGYTERGWADNHDVLLLTRNDRYRVYLAQESHGIAKTRVE